MENLKYFFDPDSVAIIGASRDTKKIGHVILRNFIQGFRGKIYPINPNANEILDLKCYPKVSAVPGSVDLAIFAVHAQMVPEILVDCGKKKVKAAIIVSGGFSEVGNYDLEKKISEIARKYKIRIIGPNCIGVYDARTKVDSLFLPSYRLGRPAEGSIALISQSGALGGAMIDWANMHGYGFSKFISYGNAVDVNETDLLEYLGSDPHTKLICLYIEGIKNGRKFMEVAEKISKKKPIIALKGGVTEEGGRAVKSHTGSLSGSARVYSAAFKQAGIIEARDLEELMDYARSLVNAVKAKGDRVLSITNGGGIGILSTDAIIESGLHLAKLSKNTEEKLRKQLPDYAVIGNPIDLVGDADTNRYQVTIEAALEDPNVDILLITILFQIPTLASDIVEVVSEKFNERKKPMIIICFGGDYTKTHKRALEKYGVPTFDHPKRAVAAIKCLVEFSKNSKGD